MTLFDFACVFIALAAGIVPIGIIGIVSMRNWIVSKHIKNHKHLHANPIAIDFEKKSRR